MRACVLLGAASAWLYRLPAEEGWVAQEDFAESEEEDEGEMVTAPAAMAPQPLPVAAV